MKIRGVDPDGIRILRACLLIDVVGVARHRRQAAGDLLRVIDDKGGGALASSWQKKGGRLEKKKYPHKTLQLGRTSLAPERF